MRLFRAESLSPRGDKLSIYDLYSYPLTSQTAVR